jgi:glutamate 5-kinase
MITKLRAARLAARSGAHTVIAGGQVPDVISRIQSGEKLGTLLTASRGRLGARKQWLAGHLQMQGQLLIDTGAVRMLIESGKSLLSVGVREVRGKFQRGEMVSCVDPQGREVARGLVNYSAEEAARLCGQPSHRIALILGYVDEPELIHRDNLVLV